MTARHARHAVGFGSGGAPDPILLVMAHPVTDRASSSHLKQHDRQDRLGVGATNESDSVPLATTRDTDMNQARAHKRHEELGVTDEPDIKPFSSTSD